MKPAKNVPEYALDYSKESSGVLDLSIKACSPENCYDRPLDHFHSPASSNSSNSRQSFVTSPVNCCEACPDPTRQNNDLQNGKSPSVCSEGKASNSPPESIQGSPTYASCYPGTDHLGELVLQTAFHQQMLLQCTKQQENKPEEMEVTKSNTNTLEGTNPAFGMYPLFQPARDGKVTRPFKAYPKDPLVFVSGSTNPIDIDSAEKYAIFRKSMLEQIRVANGGQATVSNPKMRRTMNNNNYGNDAPNQNPEMSSTCNSYTERRKKNNAAAKKSRDRRRIKEDEIAIRASYLERENVELKYEVTALKNQLEHIYKK